MKGVFIFLLVVTYFAGMVKADNGMVDVARINFSKNGTPELTGWTNVYGSNSFPLNLGNGLIITYSGGTLTGENGGEPVNTIVPNEVGSTFNQLDNNDNNPGQFTISGLDPESKYTFEVFSSCSHSSAPDEQNTTFLILDNAKPNTGEFLVFDQTFTFNESMHGFKLWNFSDVKNAPSNWKSPYDYESGIFYERYQVISQPTSRPVNFQFGLWQDEGEREAMSPHVQLNGPGDILESNSSPIGWWQKDVSTPVDFSRPGDFLQLGFPMWSDNFKLVSDWAADSDWGLHAEYIPMTLRASVVAVAKNCKFSGWRRLIGESHVINAVGNTDQVALFSGITPTSAGKITLTMKRGTSFGYINALVIKKITVSELTIEKNGHGSFNLQPGQYPKDTILKITATPDQGWKFVGWSGSVSGSENTISVPMSHDVNLGAWFQYLVPDNLVAKINFTYNSNYDEPGWTNVYGSTSFPVTLTNGVKIEYKGGRMIGANSGEVETMFPTNVGMTSAVFDVAYFRPVEFKVLGLLPESTYKFSFFTSRLTDDIPESSKDRRTSFSIGEDTVTVNSTGNTDVLLTIEGVSPSPDGIVSFFMHRYTSYGYINALLIETTNGINVGTKALSKNEAIGYYPVPVRDQLTLSNVPSRSVISVYSITGNKVIETINEGTALKLSMHSLIPGVYIVKVTNAEILKMYNFKIVKE